MAALSCLGGCATTPVSTLPQRRMRELGLSARDIVRAMNRGKRLKSREIESRCATVARAVRGGNCGALYARRLARILDLDAALLELPCQCWPAAWRVQTATPNSPNGDIQNAVETPEAPQGVSCSAAAAVSMVAGEGARRNARPRIHPQADRMHILRLVR